MMIYVKFFFTSRIKNNTYVVLFYTYERIKIIKNILCMYDTHTNRVWKLEKYAAARILYIHCGHKMN